MVEKEKRNVSFEKAIEKLEKIVADIESGEVSLEQSIEQYADGMKLIETCRSILDDAEQKIKVLSETGDGTLEESDAPDEPGGDTE